MTRWHPSAWFGLLAVAGYLSLAYGAYWISR